MVMKKNWKNRSGVSPVIATILMVAITVVLAAVLYVMVMGFGGTSSSAPTGTFTTATKASDAKSITFTFGTMSKETKFTDCKVTVSVNGGTPTTAASLPATGSVATGTFTVAVTDLGGDGKVSSGDYLTLTLTAGTVLTSGSEYKISLLYSDGSQICEKALTI
jgi:flagellin-like protein